jgi:hypothetical protein
LPNDLKHTCNEASFSPILLYLQMAQMPRSPDLAIFVLRQQVDRTDCLGNYWQRRIIAASIILENLGGGGGWFKALSHLNFTITL